MIQHRFRFSRAALLSLALFPATFVVPTAARAQAPAFPDTVSRPFEGFVVQGNGEVRVQPDIARLNLGVQTQDKDPQRAASTNATGTQAVIAALRAMGIAERDIQTASFSISPQYDYRQRPNDNGPQQPILTGYQVNNEVRVVVRRLENAGRALDAAIRAGANTASGLSFDLDNREASRDEALRRAVSDAGRKASVLSRASGNQPYHLSAIVEGGGDSGPRPMMMMARAAEGMQASTPVAAGEIVVSASVTGYYGLGAAR